MHSRIFSARAGGPHGGVFEDFGRGGLVESSGGLRASLGHRYRGYRISRAGKRLLTPRLLSIKLLLFVLMLLLP